MPKKNKPNKKQRIKIRPEQFQSYNECVKWNKKSVYLIARGRKIEDQIKWTTLGSGFLAAPNRLVTASHVINDIESKDEFKMHKKNDIYYLLRHDDENNFHLHVHPFILDKTLFIYSNIDIAIFHLEDSFYRLGDKIFVEKENYIPISKEFFTIGTDIGILGYPITALQFENNDFNKPKIGNVLLRTDVGVINCRYRTPENTFAYEFTLAFNPGNSGGPIFHAKSGRVISVVKGFKSLLMIKNSPEINSEDAKNIKIPNHGHATYSFGFATPTFLDIFQKHNIVKK